MDNSAENVQLYDAFICHASEDKGSIVRELADLLGQEHIEVWYDEFSLEVGDSIRRAIEKGLRQSRFAVVVLSSAFFGKEWPQYELDGLIEKEMLGREKVILPVWHGVDHDYVAKYSLPLAGRLAANTNAGVRRVVEQISRVIKPQASPLLIARDYLLSFSVTPPVITDKQWLQVVEASNNILPFGPVPDERSIWGRWSFPLPERSEDPTAWGERLAWAYMQMRWVQEAEDRPITPLTHYQEVTEFISSYPGLAETCRDYPTLLVEWAPQLTIPGFEGDMFKAIENAYESSCEKHQRTKPGGTALTVDGRPPRCDEDFALRHPDFGGYDSVHVAGAYFHGGMFGPTVSPYEEADHLFWLLSECSTWLPSEIRRCLLDGVAKGTRWLWGYIGLEEGGEWRNCGALAKAIHDAIHGRNFRFSSAVGTDLANRVALSIRRLSLPDTNEALIAAFKREHMAEAAIAAGEKRRLRHRKAEQDRKTKTRNTTKP